MKKINIDKLYDQAKATIELEGFRLTSEDEKAIKGVISKEVTRKQLIKELKI